MICKPKPKKAFTLIELLVVIAIIAILVVLIILALNAARQRARDSKRKTDLRSVQTALEMQNDELGSYSATTGYGALTTEIETAGNYGFGAGQMPQDTTSGEGYAYGSDGASAYALAASLETTNPDSGQTCSGTVPAGYATTDNSYCVGTDINQDVAL